MKIPPPFKIPTPYGGRLIWVLPGGNLLIAHLKDKMKIRHKKRWSQVMYIYYLLGFKIFGDLDIMEKLYKKRYGKNRSNKSKSKCFKGFGNLLNNMDDKQRIRVHIYNFFLNRWLLNTKFEQNYYNRLRIRSCWRLTAMWTSDLRPCGC